MYNIYTQTPKIVTKTLKSVLNLLNKAETFVNDGLVTEVKLIEARLAPDMFAFNKQIQVATDNAKGIVSRLSGTENPKYEDTETTIAELKTRVQKTIDFIESIPEESYNDANEVKVVLPYMPGKYQTALDYVTDYGLPNLYFHVVTSYAILRNLGLPVSKMDYINSLNLKDL